MSVVDVVNLATFAFLGTWAALSVRWIARGQRDSVLIVLVVHFLFAGVPPFLDLVYGQPSYWRFPGLYAATRDPVTAILYGIFVCACCPLWWFAARRRRPTRRDEGSVHSLIPPAWLKRTARIVAVTPLLLFWLLPAESSPMIYAGHLAYAPEDATLLQIARSATVLSVLACTALLVFYRRASWLTTIAAPILVVASAWLNGKRSIVAIAIALFGYVLWSKGYLRGARLVVVSVLAGLSFASFSYWYLSAIRGVNLASRGVEAYYEYLRVDFGRDDVIKLALFNELTPGRGTALEHRGQSLLFYATAYVPRSMWPEKPWPYAVYVTADALQVPIDYQGWGLTTSVLDEAIANFGWVGLLIGPLTIALVCRLGDRSPDSFVHLLTIMIAVLLLSVQLVAFAPLFLGWIAAVFWSSRRDRARRRAARGAPVLAR